MEGRSGRAARPGGGRRRMVPWPAGRAGAADRPTLRFRSPPGFRSSSSGPLPLGPECVRPTGRGGTSPFDPSSASDQLQPLPPRRACSTAGYRRPAADRASARTRRRDKAGIGASAPAEELFCRHFGDLVRVRAEGRGPSSSPRRAHGAANESAAESWMAEHRRIRSCNAPASGSDGAAIAGRRPRRDWLPAIRPRWMPEPCSPKKPHIPQTPLQQHRPFQRPFFVGKYFSSNGSRSSLVNLSLATVRRSGVRSSDSRPERRPGPPLRERGAIMARTMQAKSNPRPSQLGISIRADRSPQWTAVRHAPGWIPPSASQSEPSPLSRPMQATAVESWMSQASSGAPLPGANSDRVPDAGDGFRFSS